MRNGNDLAEEFRLAKEAIANFLLEINRVEPGKTPQNPPKPPGDTPLRCRRQGRAEVVEFPGPRKGARRDGANGNAAAAGLESLGSTTNG